MKPDAFKRICLLALSTLLVMLGLNALLFLAWEGYYASVEAFFDIDVLVFRRVQVGLLVLGVAISLALLRHYRKRDTNSD